LEKSNEELMQQIIKKALAFGANMAGIADVRKLKGSPSHTIYGKLDRYEGVGTRDNGGLEPGRIAWPEKAKSAVVIAVEHAQNQPDLDYWQKDLSGGTKGNRILISVIDKLADWLKKAKGIKAYKPSYFVEQGGIFLKDAAVMAGLGCIGKNNILITKPYGPRVRLRAMLLETDLPATGPVAFDPCHDCNTDCLSECPQKAFQSKIYSAKDFGLDRLPARNGIYSRQLCNHQMESDSNNGNIISPPAQDQTGKPVEYCRRCEFACPVG
jgi:epoxyqueuosine reductase